METNNHTNIRTDGDIVSLGLLGVRTDYQRKYARVACVLPAEYIGEVQLKATTFFRLPLTVPSILLSDGIEVRAEHSASAPHNTLAVSNNRATHGDACAAAEHSAGTVRVVRWSVPFRYSQFGLHLSVHAKHNNRVLRTTLPIPPQTCKKSLEAWLEERRNCQNWDGYNEWMRTHRADAEELAREREAIAAWENTTEQTPLISLICPAYETPERYLRTMLNSLIAQSYANWELVLVDASTTNVVQDVLRDYHDARIRIITVASENNNIATNTNAGIETAQGNYLAFIDHDDFIEPDCLYRFVEAIRETPTSDLLFCNEDMWEDQADTHEQAANDNQMLGTYDEVAQATGTYFGPKFKGSFDIARELAGNVVCHMLMVSRRVIDLCERTPAELAGAQDYDLTFKAYEIARDVTFVPHMLYHWRSHQQSSATNADDKPYLFEAGRAAIQQHLERRHIEASVGAGSYRLTYRTAFHADRAAFSAGGASLGAGDAPLDIALICVPNEARHTNWAERAAAAIASATDATSVQYILLYDGTAMLDEQVLDGAQTSLDKKAAPSTELVQALVGYLGLQEVGIAAPLILEQDGLVSSCGLSIDSNGEVVPMSEGLAPADTGYMQFLQCAHVATAVPSTCIAFRRADYEALGGFDTSFSTNIALVDFCLRMHKQGLVTVVEPHCTVMRGIQRANREACKAYQHDVKRLFELHPNLRTADPTLDASLLRNSAYYRLKDMDEG